jgi:hypothetical protein
MPGPVPKNAATRQRRNKTSTNARLEAPPATRVELPTRYSSFRCSECYLSLGKHTAEQFDKEDVVPHDFDPQEQAWRDLTVAWWDTIWASPMAEEWVDADVPGLVALAFLVDEFWRTGNREIAAEIRMQQREYGLSPLSRRSLQWEIIRVQRAEAGKPIATAVPVRRKDPRLRLVSGA